MSAHSVLGEAPLRIVLDLRHPFACLAFEPARRLGRELGIAIDWLPLRVPALRPPSRPAPDDDRGTRHRRYRAQAIAREIETYAAARGLVLREWYREPDPGALHLAWLWLRAERPEQLEPFLAEAFRAYWALELDPGSEPEVAALLESTAGDAAPWRAWCRGPGPAHAEAIDTALREQGVPGVPTYLVEDELFLGRQHLPMIRWILEGREGRGPI